MTKKKNNELQFSLPTYAFRTLPSATSHITQDKQFRGSADAPASPRRLANFLLLSHPLRHPPPLHASRPVRIFIFSTFRSPTLGESDHEGSFPMPPLCLRRGPPGRLLPYATRRGFAQSREGLRRMER